MERDYHEATTAAAAHNTQNSRTSYRHRASGYVGSVLLVAGVPRRMGTGAGGPNSGSTALNEAVRSCCTAMPRGWRPLRTNDCVHQLDGEEFGQVG
jgi:hypothetical protein